jgi:hypothetical protein
MGLVENAVERASIKSVLIFLAVVFASWRIYLKIDETVRLRRLGARAPRVVGRLPFGK